MEAGHVFFAILIGIVIVMFFRDVLHIFGGDDDGK